MKTWAKALWASCALELPLVVMLAARAQDIDKSTAARVLVWYHAIPLSLISFGSLWLFGHGASGGEATGFRRVLGYVLFCSLTFVVQVAVTTPILLLVLKASRGAFSRSR